MNTTDFFTDFFTDQRAAATGNARAAFDGLAELMQRLHNFQEVTIFQASASTGVFDELDADGWQIAHLDGEATLDYFSDDGCDFFYHHIDTLLTPQGKALFRTAVFAAEDK